MYFASIDWAIAWTASLSLLPVLIIYWWRRRVARRQYEFGFPARRSIYERLGGNALFLHIAASLLVAIALWPIALAAVDQRAPGLGTLHATVAAQRHAIDQQRDAIATQQRTIDSVTAAHRRLAEEVALLKTGCPNCQSLPPSQGTGPEDLEDFLGPIGWSGLGGFAALLLGFVFYFGARDWRPHPKKSERGK